MQETTSQLRVKSVAERDGAAISKLSPTIVSISPGKPASFQGVVAAMITPCRAPGKIDPHAAGRLAGIITAKGCDGIFVVSSTGESVFLDEAERREMIAGTRSGCPADKTLYAGVTGFGVNDTIRQTRAAATEHADVAVVMAPFFARIAQNELRDFVTAIADASPIPVCMYHHWRMPTGFEIDTIVSLAEHPNIVAMKETSEEPDRITAILAATAHTKMTLLHGNERLILQTLRAGGHGCVSALATIAPEWHRHLLASWKAQDLSTVTRMEQSIIALWQMFAMDTTRSSFSHFVHSLKRAAWLRGWLDSTAGMVPGFRSTPEFDQDIENHLRQVGLLEEFPVRP